MTKREFMEYLILAHVHEFNAVPVNRDGRVEDDAITGDGFEMKCMCHGKSVEQFLGATWSGR